MMSERFHTVSFGSAYDEENIYNTPVGGIRLGKEVICGEYEIVPGGSAPYFARACAALDLKSVFVGKAANDRRGNELIELFAEEGVTTAFIRSSEHQTTIARNFITHDGSVVMTVAGNANKSIQPEEVVEKLQEIIPRTDFLYLGGALKLVKFMSYYEKLVQYAHDQGAKVILDHGRVHNEVSEEQKELMRRLVTKVDRYYPSKEEFLKLWRVKSIEKGLDKIRSQVDTLIVVKDEANGAVGCIGDKVVYVPAFYVKKVQFTVGAGDTFNAAVTKAEVNGLNLEERIQYANAAGALKVSEPGLPTHDAVMKLLRTA